MELPTIHNWHIVIPGFLQNEGEPVGMVWLWNDLHHIHTGPETAVVLREWKADWNALAELIWRLRGNYRPRIAVYAYSWGGMSAMILARQLQGRGLDVDWMVLSDPVYRHWYSLGNWRLLVPWSRIVVPSNVRRVDWFQQRTDLPQAHRLVAADPTATHIGEPWEAFDVKHSYMDDLREFQKRCREVARNLVPGESHALQS